MHSEAAGSFTFSHHTDMKDLWFSKFSIIFYDEKIIMYYKKLK